MKKRLTRPEKMQARIPFPDLPLPSKYKKMRKTSRSDPTPSIEPEPMPEPVKQKKFKPKPPQPQPGLRPIKPAKPKSKLKEGTNKKPVIPEYEPEPQVDTDISIGFEMDITDPIIGKVEPEPPKIVDNGNHVIEDLDSSDYNNAT